MSKNTDIKFTQEGGGVLKYSSLCGRAKGLDSTVLSTFCKILVLYNRFLVFVQMESHRSRHYHIQSLSISINLSGNQRCDDGRATLPVRAYCCARRLYCPGIMRVIWPRAALIFAPL